MRYIKNHNDCVALLALADPEIDPRRWQGELTGYLDGLSWWMGELGERADGLVAVMRTARVHESVIARLGEGAAGIKAGAGQYRMASSVADDWVASMRVPFGGKG